MVFGAGKVWGLDLGRSAVKGVLVKRVGSSVEILKVDAEPLRGQPAPGLADPSRDTRLWEALKRFQQRNRIAREKIVVAIPGQNTFSRNITIARVGGKSLDELLQYEASNEIPFVLDEVFWDYHLFPAPKGTFEVAGMLYAAKKASIHTYLHALGQAGFSSIDDITISPVGLLNFFWRELDRSVSSMIIDVGCETTNMVAIVGDRFWFRSLAGGGQKVTQLIESEFDLPYAQAEAAKKNIAQSPFAEQILECVMPSVHDFVAQVRLALSHFQGVSGIDHFDRYYILGGGSRLTGLQRAVTQVLGKEPATLERLEHVVVNSAAGVDAVRAELDRLPVAVGAAMQALRVGATNVSFIPTRAAKRAEQTRRRPWVVAFLLLIGALLGTLYGFERVFARGLEAVVERTNAVTAKYDMNQSALARFRDNTRIIQETNVLATVAYDRTHVLAVLAGMVGHFEAASRGGGFRFQLYSVRLGPGEPTAAPDVKKTPAAPKQPETKVVPSSGRWLMLEVKGVMKLPRGGEPGQAYDNLDSRLIRALMNDKLFAKVTTPRATFTDKKTQVVLPEAKLVGLVRPGDWIKLDEDGIWYGVAAVKSNTEIELTRPFEGQTMTGPATICQVECKYFDREQLSFQLNAELPVPERPVPMKR